MAPKNGSNSCKVITPATQSTAIAFAVKPSGSTETVSPATTNSSQQTITVNGVTAGTGSHVNVGIGTTISSGTGLGIDVKPMPSPVTVAIHAVTQHYTTPMVLNTGMTGTPGTVCVSGSHVLHTTPVSPDQSGPDGSLTIVTGADGICHTPADSQDTQVIPVGQALPADIAPADVPSASDLQTYLNQVYGVQANLYFTVTRSDFSVDYDVKKDGTLDVILRQDLQSEGQNIIDGNKSSGVRFNVFYVKDFQGIPVSGTMPDHTKAGYAYYPYALAYVRDCSSIQQVATHEIGHLLNLAHPGFPFLPSRDPNPAYIPDPAVPKRLMYPTSSGSNTFLIKPEWDIINHNDGSP
jgi:hypothetical protein